MKMRKIIDGLLYDTETASEICNVTSHGASPYGSDSEYEDTRLYRTKNGRFFTAGEGGAMSVYARVSSNNRSGGEALVPVSADEARSLVERFGTTDIYVQLFGPPEAA